MTRRTQKEGQLEVVVVPVGTPEEAADAKKNAMRILAGWIRRQEVLARRKGD